MTDYEKECFMVQGFSSSSNSTNPHSEFVQEGQQGTCLCVFLMLHYNSSHANFSQTILVHTQNLSTAGCKIFSITKFGQKFRKINVQNSFSANWFHKIFSKWLTTVRKSKVKHDHFQKFSVKMHTWILPNLLLEMHGFLSFRGIFRLFWLKDT